MCYALSLCNIDCEILVGTVQCCLSLGTIKVRSGSKSLSCHSVSTIRNQRYHIHANLSFAILVAQILLLISFHLSPGTVSAKWVGDLVCQNDPCHD
ncbi:UNVERIFIED_CONTAM: hypothetical protein K2H54_015033 [Gekko kuhli]